MTARGRFMLCEWKYLNIETVFNSILMETATVEEVLEAFSSSGCQLKRWKRLAAFRDIVRRLSFVTCPFSSSGSCSCGCVSVRLTASLWPYSENVVGLLPSYWQGCDS
jgi:hypothetical protein